MSHKQVINVFSHLQQRYLDRRLDLIQGNSMITNRKGMIIEGSSICNQYNEWNELISTFSDELISIQVLSTQWLESYTKIQHSIRGLCNLSCCDLPDSELTQETIDTSFTSLIETIQTVSEHCKERFNSIVQNAAQIIEQRKKLLVLKEQQKTIVENTLTATEKDNITYSRIKSELERTGQQLSALLDSARSITGSFLKSAGILLQNSFQTLFSQPSSNSQLTSNVAPTSNSHCPEIKSAFDNLLISAFNTSTLSSTSSPHQSHEETSTTPSRSEVSPQSCRCDLSPQQSLTSYSPSILSLTDISPTNISEHDNESLPRSDDITPQAMPLIPPSPPRPYKSHRIHTYLMNSETVTIEELFPSIGYDIVRIVYHPHCYLILTSRGNVLSYLSDSSYCPVVSGLVNQSLSSSSSSLPSLITSLQLERAIRNKRYTAIACGSEHAVAVAASGEVYTWGKGEQGELGLGDIKEIAEPETCVKLCKYHIVKVTCGFNHTLALDDKGHVFSWGYNQYGQLGHGDKKDRKEPRLIEAFKRLKITEIAAGGYFSAAIDSKGRVFCWGCNINSQCGSPPSVECLLPTLVRPCPSEVIQLCCGEDHCLGLCQNGEVISWGCGKHHEMGIDMDIVYATEPQIIPLTSVLQENETICSIHCYSHRSAAITSLNHIISWGSSYILPTIIYSAKEGHCITDIALTPTSTIILEDNEGTYSLTSTLDTSNNDDTKYTQYLHIRSASLEWTLSQRQLIRSWIELHTKPGGLLHSDHSLSSLLEKGIPPILRQRIWPQLLGNALKITPETYNLYHSRAMERNSLGHDVPSKQIGKEATVHLIDEDLKRTFVPLGFFSVGEPLYERIHDVLLTYAYYRPDIGYVQGMSFLAGILALHISDSYLCFQCLANLLGSEHLFAFYSLKPGFMKQYYEVFNSIFETVNPILYHYFISNNIQVDLFLFKWLQSLFAQCFAIDITSRIWDNFFYEGTQYLFRTALAVLKLLQPVIMKIPIEECLSLLTGSIRKAVIWKETITMENLFAMIQKIKFSDKQQQKIVDLVQNAFFYDDPDKLKAKSRAKIRKSTEGLTQDEVRNALSTVF